MKLHYLKQKKIKLTLDNDKNNKYNIEMKFISGSIFITAKSMNIIPLKFFEEKFSFSTIKQNKYFSPCESIDDVFLSLEPNINSKLHFNRRNFIIKLINLSESSFNKGY